jgi:electron transfer flavoprotein beta subunit
LNILVFIKQVADTEGRISIQGDRKSLEIENKYNINFFDEFAVEEAIRLKEKMKEGQITVCTLGSKRAIEALRTAVAMGADRAFLIDDCSVASDDPLIVAKILASFARQEAYDLILCGRQAIDDENGLVGVMVAEFMSIPHVSAALRLDLLDAGTVRVETEVEGGRATMDVRLPALVTAQKGLNTPRVPLITGVMKAMKVTIPLIDPLSLGLDGTDIDGAASKTPVVFYDTKPARPPVKMIEGESPEEKAKKLVSALKEEARVL